MTSTRTLAVVAGALGISLVLAACGGGETSSELSEETTAATTEETGSGELTGSINLDGSSTVGPLSEVAAELFMQQYPGVQVTVAVSGTGGGFEKFCNGETDGNNASREIKDEEVANCEANGIASDNITVANDALTILVNQENPLQCITIEQANQIWGDGSTVSTWGDVEGLDIPADFADTPIALYGPGTDSGTFDFFTDVVNGEEGSIRIDYTSIGEDDNAAVTAISGDVGAMGYVPFAFYQESLDLVKGLEIDGGNGCIAPTPENVLDGSYTPLGRELYVYASNTALAKPETVEFFNFYINNAAQIAEIAGAVGLSPEQTEAQLAKVAALSGS
jgi:phosphate transport system substrate-binding protein